jgi:hypothetical protein
MTRKNKCVECRHCEMRIDPKKGTRHHCTAKKKILPVDACSRPACDRFELPEVSGHWGP